MTWLAKVFEVKWEGLNLRRGAVFAVVLGLLIVVGVLPHDRRYFLSAIFGALLVALSDPGGKYGPRVLAMAAMAGAGALLTALGFGIGGGPWGFVVLAAFVATSLAGLAVKYGLHRFVAAYLLNIWFIIVLGLPTLLSFGASARVPFRPDPYRTVETGAGLADRIGAVGRLHLHHVAGARTRLGAPACRRDPRGYLAEAADPANDPVRGDPGRRRVDRRRDRVRAEAAQRLLDADCRHYRDEARPSAIHLRCRTARRRHGAGRRRWLRSSC